MFDYFGFKTLEKGYLLKTNGVVIERPQHMWMRVAIQLHGKSVMTTVLTADYYRDYLQERGVNYNSVSQSRYERIGMVIVVNQFWLWMILATRKIML